MQVFIVGTPLETASALDPRRLNKQIVECQQILDALDGKTAWSNHPCTLQYKGHERWLGNYRACLMRYRAGLLDRAKVSSDVCDKMRPPFHTEEYFDQMKRRLYCKNKEHYSQWKHLGTTEVNWYYIDGEWRYYKNGKRVKESI